LDYYQFMDVYGAKLRCGELKTTTMDEWTNWEMRAHGTAVCRLHETH